GSDVCSSDLSWCCRSRRWDQRTFLWLRTLRGQLATRSWWGCQSRCLCDVLAGGVELKVDCRLSGQTGLLRCRPSGAARCHWSIVELTYSVSGSLYNRGSHKLTWRKHV